MKQVRGYKVFNPDFTCRGFQYEVGKTYTHKGEIGICEAGFHFCEKLIDCFCYYDFNPKNKVAEVIATGKTIKGGYKYVTNKIKIVREIDWNDVLNLVNIGTHNTGLGNTGGSNSGHFNSGIANLGNNNSGHFNSGYANSGKFNSGEYNSGGYNSGDYNSGLFNACSYSNGIFNSESPKIYMFNKPTPFTMEELEKGYTIALNILRTAHLDLKKPYKRACQKWWDGLMGYEKEAIKSLPNFDKKVFKEITGIEV